MKTEDEHGQVHNAKNKLQKDILSKHNAKLSSFHAGDLTRNPIRILMRGGDAIFLEISDCLTSMNNVGNPNDVISNDKGITTCKCYRSDCCLLDK